MKRYLKTISLLISIGLLTITLIWGGTFASNVSKDQGSHQFLTPQAIALWDNTNRCYTEISFTPQIRENSLRLREVSDRLGDLLSTFIAKDVPLAGTYVDVFTCTFYVGFTDLKEEYTKPIESIALQIPDVKLTFFRAKFTERELRNFQRKIEKTFLGITPDDLERLYTLKDEAKEKMIGKLREEERLARSKGVPVNMVAVDVRNNGLLVGFKELKPDYIEAVRRVVGDEVPIQFTKGSSMLDTGTRDDRHRPLVGGIRIETQGAEPGFSTLGFRATHRDGTRGFVMTGHAGWVNESVWQPDGGWLGWKWFNRVGVIYENPRILNWRHSDAAFVRTLPDVSINSTLWPNKHIVGWQHSTVSRVGDIVWKDGITTGTTIGVVDATGVTLDGRSSLFERHRLFGTLFNQVFATYSRGSGDSGGPVYSELGVNGIDPYVVVLGVHAGWREGWCPRDNRWKFVAVYSPVEGIMRDLNLREGSH